MSDPEYFRHCSTCKTPIAFGANYFKCSVSTCNRKATALYFCSVPCWDAHLPEARHRDAWAEQETAPSRAEFLATRDRESERGTASSERSSANAPAPMRRVVSTPGEASNSASAAVSVELNDTDLPRDVLIVVSKLKAYVKARSGMSTSDGVLEVLSDHLRDVCTKAIRSAGQNSRKTVLARDFEAVLSGRVADE